MEVAFLCGGGIRMYKPWNWFTLVLYETGSIILIHWIMWCQQIMGNVLAWFFLMGRKYG